MAKDSKGSSNLRALAVTHALVGYDIFIVSLLNMCLGWSNDTGVYIHLVCLVVYTPVAVSLWLMYNDDESGFTLSKGAKFLSGMILISIASGIVLTSILNWKVAHIYALSAQVLSGVYAGTAGFFMILLFTH